MLHKLLQFGLDITIRFDIAHVNPIFVCQGLVVYEAIADSFFLVAGQCVDMSVYPRSIEKVLSHCFGSALHLVFQIAVHLHKGAVFGIEHIVYHPHAGKADIKRFAGRDSRLQLLVVGGPVQHVHLDCDIELVL